MKESFLKNTKRVVIKIGSSLLIKKRNLIVNGYKVLLKT